jgi:aminotransferase
MLLLERARVAAIPGSAFYRGATGEKYLRFCFAKNEAELNEACTRLRALD